jgi:hypothetical protein
MQINLRQSTFITIYNIDFYIKYTAYPFWSIFFSLIIVQGLVEQFDTYSAIIVNTCGPKRDFPVPFSHLRQHCVLQYLAQNCTVEFGYKPRTCWIAQAKETCGLSPKAASNRKDLYKREHPCPKKTRGYKEGISTFVTTKNGRMLAHPLVFSALSRQPL